MGQHTELDKKMKDFEKRFTDVKLLKKVPAIIRIDGKAFHSYTKKCEKPFSALLHDAMVYTIKKTVKEMSGVKAVYTQSDEISFWLSDEMGEDTQGWFDWKLQKLTSVSASIFTFYFNEFMRPHIKEVAFFDSRAFSLPNHETMNEYFSWREQDAVKNSISMLAQHHFSHKSLHGLNTCKMQDKLMLEKQVNWNDIDPWKKRGSLIVKVQTEKDVSYVDNRTGETEIKKGVLRKEWQEVDFFSFKKTPIQEIVREKLEI